MLSLRPNKRSRRDGGHAPGKDTPRAANAATERGLTGENARANAVSRRALSPVKKAADMCRHSDTLRGAKRRRKRGSRGENRISVSEFCCLPVLICLPVIPKEGANGGENARASVLRSEGVCSPVKSHISSVLFIPSRSRHLPTTSLTAAVSATRNAFVLSSAFMTGQS